MNYLKKNPENNLHVSDRDELFENI